ncbi:MAG: hydantoinase/oxoprolinase family protein, partial [Candidatus Binatia bacterium]
TPMIRIETIGAGGGSLAWRDEGEALRVGPRSAGSHPGPIAYGRGGRHVTLTDAHLHLGRIPPSYFLGGTMKIHPAKIRGPLSSLAKSLKLSVDQTAEGIVTVANHHMARALRVLSLQRGHDPREFTLLPFGGAGGLHACELADLLDMPRVLIPLHPGVLSAFGMAFADWVRDYVQTVLWKDPSLAELTRMRGAMKKRAAADARRAGFGPKQILWNAQIDLRYAGQSYEVTVPLDKNFKRSFERAHRRLYGFLHRKRPIEAVNLRLQARIPRSVSENLAVPHPEKAVVASRPRKFLKSYWRGKRLRAPLHVRESLAPGQVVDGPAVIAEYSATTFIPPGWRASVETAGHLILSKL